MRHLYRNDMECTHEREILQQRKEELRVRKLKKFNRLKSKTEQNGSIPVYLECENVLADGNCFYRCISKWLYGNEDEHLEVRKKIVSHMRAYAECYRSYIDGDIHDHFDRQENANGTTDSWATEAEVSAAATMYSAKIRIYVVEKRQVTTLEFLPQRGNGVNGDKQINLKLANEHFEYLVDKPTRVRAPVAVHNSCRNSSTSQSFDWFDMEPMKSSDAGKADNMVTRGKNRKEAPLEKHRRGVKYDRRKEKEINKGNDCKNEEIVTNIFKETDKSRTFFTIKRVLFCTNEKDY